MADRNIVRELIVLLGIETDKKSEKILDKFDKSIPDIKSKFMDLGKTLAWVGAGITAFGAAVLFNSRAVANDALQIQRQAAALGMTTDAYQEIRGALAAFGVDQRDVADLFGQIAQQATAAQAGSKPVIKIFDQLGVSVKSLKGASPEQIFERLAEGIKNTTDPTERLGAANALLGEDLAKKTIPMLLEGAAGIAKYRKRVKDLGGVMSADAIIKNSQFSQSMAETGIAITGLRNEVATRFVPVLKEMLDGFNNWYIANKELILQNLYHYIDTISDSMRSLRDILIRVDHFVQTRIGSWEPIFEGVAASAVAIVGAFTGYQFIAAMTALAGGIGVLAEFATGGSVTLLIGLAAAIAAAAAGFVAAGLAAQDFYTYMQGGKSYTGDIISQYKGMNSELGRLADFLFSAGVFFKQLKVTVGDFAVFWTAVFDSVSYAWMDFNTDLENTHPNLAKVVGFLSSIATALQQASAFAGTLGTQLLNLGTLGLQGVSGGLQLGTQGWGQIKAQQVAEHEARVSGGSGAAVNKTANQTFNTQINSQQSVGNDFKQMLKRANSYLPNFVG